MKPTDSSVGDVRLRPAWSALGHRIAAVVGAGTALLGLLRHVPVPIATFRGATGWFAVLLLFRAGGALLGRLAVRGAGPAAGANEQEVSA